MNGKLGIELAKYSNVRRQRVGAVVAAALRDSNTARVGHLAAKLTLSVRGRGLLVAQSVQEEARAPCVMRPSRLEWPPNPT